MKIFTIFLSALLVNNFVLSRFLGICPFLGVSKKVETATGMGAAVTFVMALASIMTFLVEKLILAKLDIMYLSTLAFILVIASLVQFVEMVIKKVSPDLYKALGIFLPLITTNCAVLGVAVINSDEGYNLIESLVNSVGAALGFTLALVLLAGIREKLDTNEYIPEALKGLPITLVTAGLMAIAFLGFQGLI
ncbi:MAG: electron transport complex subunit RsxA [Clostridium cochlearium]|uniref:electron transport complex subunit RsxA n=1 Tax=Clostridium cochlearium TaxID=1494 RepID=UPI00280B52A0|nr:electron transport complex subunit RsxA [Clostridium cochlearium]MDU1442486.1 electron transport complex subunit RsxA [Clostridium cochlearium]